MGNAYTVGTILGAGAVPVNVRSAAQACAVFLCALIIAAGCELVDPVEEVAGEWLFSARNLTGAGVGCQVEGLRLLLVQDGTRFSGTATDGEMSCVQDGEAVDIALGSLPVISGRLIGTRVTFGIGSAAWSVDGRLSGGSMEGTMQMVVGEPVGSVTVSGQFGAARVDSLQAN